jgi:hypothetical protein
MKFVFPEKQFETDQKRRFQSKILGQTKSGVVVENEAPVRTLDTS